MIENVLPPRHYLLLSHSLTPANSSEELYKHLTQLSDEKLELETKKLVAYLNETDLFMLRSGFTLEERKQYEANLSNSMNLQNGVSSMTSLMK